MKRASPGPPWSSAASSPRTMRQTLTAMGVAKVYTPKDFQLNRIMLDLVALADPAPV